MEGSFVVHLRLANAAAPWLAPGMTPDSVPADAARRRVWVARCAVLVALGLGAARLAALVWTAAVNLPFQDQWDLLRPMFAGAGPWTCFGWQHGPHRQGLGGLINWALYRATDWDVRAEAWAGAAILFLAALVTLALARRLRGELRWTDAGLPLLLLSTVNWETMLLTANISHGILPLLLTLGLGLAWTIRHPASQVTALVLLGFLSVFTGFALFAGVTTAVLAGFLAARRVQPAWLTWAVLGGFAVAVALFARGYVWEPAVPNWRFPVENVADYPRFLALMYASLLGMREISLAATLAGGLLLGAVLAAFAWSLVSLWREQTARAASVALLTGTSLLFGAFTAVGRLPAGIEAAFMWRYLPLLLPGIVGVTLWLPQLPAGRMPLDLLGLLLAIAVWSNFTPDRYAVIIADGKRLWIERYLATRDLAAANRESDYFVYRADENSPLIAERLRWLEARKLSFFKDK